MEKSNQFRFNSEVAATEPEQLVENQQILDWILTNEIECLMLSNLGSQDLNFLEAHPATDLDELITPLAQAAFLGRL